MYTGLDFNIGDFTDVDAILGKYSVITYAPYTKPIHKTPSIKTVHFSGPVTVVIWDDGTKSMVRCNNENVDHEKGLAMAIAKKFLGTNKSGSNYYDIFKKWLPENKEEVSE